MGEWLKKKKRKNGKRWNKKKQCNKKPVSQ